MGLPNSTDSCGSSTSFLTVRRPEFRVGCLLFLFRRPNLFTRVGELARDALHLGGDAIERIAKADVLSQLLEAAGLAQAEKRLVDVVAGELCLLADELLDLRVVDGEAELVGGCLENELARNRARRLLHQAADQIFRPLPGHREVGLELDAARLDLPLEAAKELAHARIDERARSLCFRCLDKGIDDLGAELRLDFLGDLRAETLLNIGLQLVERVELARRARELVV